MLDIPQWTLRTPIVHCMVKMSTFPLVRKLHIAHMYRLVRCRSSWNHSHLVNLSVVEVEQHIQENKAWTASPEVKSIARFINTAPRGLVSAADMTQYIQKRGPQELAGVLSAPAVRTLSALLTFPLTLAYGLSHIFPPRRDLKSVKILVVGARSESSLPMSWWQEMLFANTNLFSHHIRMVGPGLQQNKEINGDSSCTADIRELTMTGDNEYSKFLRLTNNYSLSTAKKLHDDFSVLHEHPEGLKLLQWADVFVLFNPGYGNDTLKALWDPTMKLLLQTRKPVLCTAFGAHDLKRDLMTLDAISSETDDQELGEPIYFLIPPHENPFKTFKCTLDPREPGDHGIVTTNHSIYAIQAN